MKHPHKLRIAGSGKNKMGAIGCIFRGLWKNSAKTANVCLRSAPKPAVLFSSNTGKILRGETAHNTGKVYFLWVFFFSNEGAFFHPINP